MEKNIFLATLISTLGRFNRANKKNLSHTLKKAQNASRKVARSSQVTRTSEEGHRKPLSKFQKQLFISLELEHTVNIHDHNNAQDSQSKIKYIILDKLYNI